jgi:hypothetical protein
MPAFPFPFQPFAYLVALVPFALLSCAANTSEPSQAFSALKAFYG